MSKVSDKSKSTQKKINKGGSSSIYLMKTGESEKEVDNLVRTKYDSASLKIEVSENNKKKAKSPPGSRRSFSNCKEPIPKKLVTQHSLPRQESLIDSKS